MARGSSSHAFSMVPRADIPRSSFDRSHGLKTTFDSGFLIPIFTDEVLPGDTFNCSMTGIARLATPLHPFMDNLYMSTFFFFVPNRLVWDNWQKFNGEQRNPGDSTDFLIPQVTPPAPGYGVGGLGDYFGLPTDIPNKPLVNALYFRAYNLVWNEWFRDENLQTSVPNPVNDGPDAYTGNYGLLKRGKRHDYFTSSLPWPQKGQSVSIPLGTQALVQPLTPNAIPSFKIGANAGTFALGTATASTTATTWGSTVATAGSAGWSNPNLMADLSTATAATINQLRQAFQVQRLYERDARGGTRYTEIIRSHFGVVSPDARLQRPEYLGGGRSFINSHAVPQTSEGGAGNTPQGNLAAYSTAVLSNHGFSKSFTEHGVIIGLVCVHADLNYQQGLNRKWSRRSRFDYYWPALSHIGEQAVLSKEIYLDGTAGDDTVWGYQERYAEYRYKPSVITGEMRSNFAQSLDTWHLAQDFATRPLLNAAFIEENPPVDRILAVTGSPQFIGDFHFNLRCARPMPIYGVPGLIDHF